MSESISRVQEELGQLWQELRGGGGERAIREMARKIGAQARWVLDLLGPSCLRWVPLG